MSSPHTRRRIPDGSHCAALPSTRNRSEDSSAPRRRLTAGGASQQLPGSAAGSLARWQVAAPPSRHGCRAPRVPTATRFAAQRRRSTQDIRMPTVPWSPCPRLRQRPRVQHPPIQWAASGRCPASARPVSSARRPCPMSSVRCPVSDVRCPVSGVRVSVRRPRHFSAPVSSWSAWVRQAATRLRTGRVR